MQFRLIFESSRDAIGVAKAGIHLMANPAYLRMFGYESMAELEGVPILTLIAPGERARIEQYAAMRARGEPVPLRLAAMPARRARRSILCGTTAPASTCAMRTSCLLSFNGCTP